MGYIMPVTPYDYKQYQNRMRQTSESPYYIASVYKTVFHPIHTTYEEEKAALDDLSLEEGQGNKTNGNNRSFLLTKWQKANLTGKGGTINEEI